MVLRAAGTPHLLSDQVGQVWLGALDLKRTGLRNWEGAATDLSRQILL